MKSVTRSILVATLSLFMTGLANADSVIQDGTFQQPIGSGFDPSTPWNDWTSVGISTHAASSPIQGNYASIPYNGALFQRYSGPTPGNYTLSFEVQNASPNPANLIIFIQGEGGGYDELVEILNLAVSSSFVQKSIAVRLTYPLGSDREIVFSNSYAKPFSKFPPSPLAQPSILPMFLSS